MGLFFLLENLDVIYVDDLWRYWPVLLIVIGFARLIDIFRVSGPAPYSQRKALIGSMPVARRAGM